MAPHDHSPDAGKMVQKTQPAAMSEDMRAMVAAMMTDEDAINRAAEAMLNLHRARNGFPATTLDSMKPEHRAEWIEDAMAAFSVFAQ